MIIYLLSDTGLLSRQQRRRTLVLVDVVLLLQIKKKGKNKKKIKRDMDVYLQLLSNLIYVISKKKATQVLRPLVTQKSRYIVKVPQTTATLN